MKEMWERMKTITGCSSKRRAPVEGEVGRANQLNNFFNRFDHPISFTPSNTATPTPTLLYSHFQHIRGLPPHTAHRCLWIVLLPTLSVCSQEAVTAWCHTCSIQEFHCLWQGGREREREKDGAAPVPSSPDKQTAEGSECAGSVASGNGVSACDFFGTAMLQDFFHIWRTSP